MFSPNNFTDTDEIAARLSAFENHYNRAARPFRWMYTTTDLTDFLSRLDNHKSDHRPRAICHPIRHNQRLQADQHRLHQTRTGRAKVGVRPDCRSSAVLSD